MFRRTEIQSRHTLRMNSAEATRLLLLHSFSLDELDNPQMTGGFLGSLRPYKALRPENFHQVMEAIGVLKPQLQAPQIDCEIMRSLWSIYHLARAWGVHPDGMLRRNNLITPADVERLESWIEAISETTSLLLEGADIEVAFESYRDL